MLFETTKRLAVRNLQRTRDGEALLLHTYLFGEEEAEGSALAQLAARQAPEWLAPRVEKHRADERRHARLLEAELARLGVARKALKLDPVSQWKLRRIQQLIDERAPRFEAGHLVTLLATAMVLEEMAARVFARHLELLEAGDPLRSTLEVLLRDERKHVRLCADSLDKLVAVEESDQLRALLEEVRRVERSFRLTGALALLGAGLWFRARGPRRELGLTGDLQ
ncbi:MAG: hypothetical protein QM723_10955 [Myxococcaceae bacterium]